MSVFLDTPPLENGDQLSATEFLRRFEAMPNLKKAELIQGQVYIMSSPVRFDQHAYPDGLVQGWLFTYAVHTPGVKHGSSGKLVHWIIRVVRVILRTETARAWMARLEYRL